MRWHAMHRPARRAHGAVVAILFLLMAHPAPAYVKGNYMYHFWCGLGSAIEGSNRAEGEIGYGLKQLEYCRRAVERRTERIAEELASISGAEAEAYQRVISFHRDLRIPAANEEEARQERLLAMMRDGRFATLCEDIAFARSVEDQALSHDVEAFFAEQRDRDFAKGLAERERAVEAWAAAVDAIHSRADGIKATGDAAEQRRAYLAECASRFEGTADFLKAELTLARDPEGLLDRYAFFRQIAKCYSSTGDGRQERIWEILRDTYRGKVRYAVEQARQTNGDSPDLARIERQLDPDRSPEASPKGPGLYYLPEMELPFFHYLGPGQGYGSTTEIANELLRHNRQRSGEDGDSGERHEDHGGGEH